ncbi:uncharacterized protein PgNI_12241 [Pyricularia grisea]|uniref:Uncharacterized protein n=1 Tax=Pyricularia grisea TaxID=148305 RepID=A0A6P8AMX8_PYRGI|nr:uncharacterized protein PgNI_12241 [Pyricularia grisea]TLD03371.1 hypothetical protein PgNI_12241 [Pyricularia grisea]
MESLPQDWQNRARRTGLPTRGWRCSKSTWRVSARRVFEKAFAGGGDGREEKDGGGVVLIKLHDANSDQVHIDPSAELFSPIVKLRVGETHHCKRGNDSTGQDEILCPRFDSTNQKGSCFQLQRSHMRLAAVVHVTQHTSELVKTNEQNLMVLVHRQTCEWIDHVCNHVILEHVAEIPTDPCEYVDSYRRR